MCQFELAPVLWTQIKGELLFKFDRAVADLKPIITLEPEQVQQLLIVAEGERNAMMYQVAIVTGLREGEILGLKWADLDWERRHLKIKRQVQRVPRQGLVFSAPKTKAGERWQEFDLIFRTLIGTPMDPPNLLKEFKALLKFAGLPIMPFHDLRHTSTSTQRDWSTDQGSSAKGRTCQSVHHDQYLWWRSDIQNG